MDFSANNSSDTTKPDREAIAARFSQLGGVFLTEPAELAARMGQVRGIVMDWDGVFNEGVKGDGVSSTFCEADSMGTNLLRYALWRRDGRLPTCAIITGELNPSARRFASRECFDALYQGVKDKATAVEELCSAFALQRSQLLCVFDDVNDLAMARGCAVRVLVRRRASPLLEHFVVEHELADYVTASGPRDHAVREVAELLLGLMGASDAVFQSRVAFDQSYADYMSARQAVSVRLAPE